MWTVSRFEGGGGLGKKQGGVVFEGGSRYPDAHFAMFIAFSSKLAVYKIQINLICNNMHMSNYFFPSEIFMVTAIILCCFDVHL